MNLANHLRRPWLMAGLALLCACGTSLPSTDAGADGGADGGSTSGRTVMFNSAFAWVDTDRDLFISDENDPRTTTRLTSTGGVFTPSFSRDGRSMVFVRETAQGSELTLLRLPTVEVSTLRRSTATEHHYATPTFSPDGTQLAFSFDDATNRTSIAVVQVDGQGFRVLTAGAAVNTASPSWYPDGRALLVSTGTSGVHDRLEKVDLSTGRFTTVAATLGPEAMGIRTRVVLSPDGRLAVFDADRVGALTTIYVVDLTSGLIERQRAYLSTAPASAPTWVDPSSFLFSVLDPVSPKVVRQVAGAGGAQFTVALGREPAFFRAP